MRYWLPVLFGVCGCVPPHAPPPLPLDAQIETATPGNWSPDRLVTYDDRGASGSVALGVRGAIRFVGHCVYVDSYGKRILAIWPRSATALTSPTSIRYGGATFRDGDQVSLRGAVRFDQASPPPNIAQSGCDASNVIVVAPRGIRRP